MILFENAFVSLKTDQFNESEKMSSTFFFWFLQKILMFSVKRTLFGLNFLLRIVQLNSVTDLIGWFSVAFTLTAYFISCWLRCKASGISPVSTCSAAAPVEQKYYVLHGELYFVFRLIGVLCFQMHSYMLLRHSLLLNVLNFYRRWAEPSYWLPLRRFFHLCSMYFICSFQFSLESNTRPKNFALPSTFTGWLFKLNWISRSFRRENTAIAFSSEILKLRDHTTRRFY